MVLFKWFLVLQNIYEKTGKNTKKTRKSGKYSRKNRKNTEMLLKNPENTQ